MAKYKADELHSVLYGIDCFLDGEETETGQVWYTPNGYILFLPKPSDGWYDADVIDIVLADRWLPKPHNQPKRYD